MLNIFIDQSEILVYPVAADLFCTHKEKIALFKDKIISLTLKTYQCTIDYLKQTCHFIERKTENAEILWGEVIAQGHMTS